MFYSVVTGRSGQKVGSAMLVVWIIIFSLGLPCRWDERPSDEMNLDLRLLLICSLRGEHGRIQPQDKGIHWHHAYAAETVQSWQRPAGRCVHNQACKAPQRRQEVDQNVHCQRARSVPRVSPLLLFLF